MISHNYQPPFPTSRRSLSHRSGLGLTFIGGGGGGWLLLQARLEASGGGAEVEGVDLEQ